MTQEWRFTDIIPGCCYTSSWLSVSHYFKISFYLTVQKSAQSTENSLSYLQGKFARLRAQSGFREHDESTYR
jgi:hypothetical protein